MEYVDSCDDRSASAAPALPTQPKRVAILCTTRFAQFSWTQTPPDAFTLYSWFFGLLLKPAIQPPHCSSARTKMISLQNMREHLIARLSLRTLPPLLSFAGHRFTSAQLSCPDKIKASKDYVNQGGLVTQGDLHGRGCKPGEAADPSV